MSTPCRTAKRSSSRRYELPDHPQAPPHGGDPGDRLELGADDVLRPIDEPHSGPNRALRRRWASEGATALVSGWPLARDAVCQGAAHHHTRLALTCRASPHGAAHRQSAGCDASSSSRCRPSAGDERAGRSAIRRCQGYALDVAPCRGWLLRWPRPQLSMCTGSVTRAHNLQDLSVTRVSQLMLRTHERWRTSTDESCCGTTTNTEHPRIPDIPADS